MHRFLKLKAPRSNSLPRLSLNNELKLTEKSCVFCRNLQNQISFRHQSTILHPNQLITPKTRKRRTKRFNTTELLEVSNRTTMQRTTKIQTASANDLNKFLEKNDNKVNSISNDFHLLDHTYNDLAVIYRFNNEENNISYSLPRENFRIMSMLRHGEPHKNSSIIPQNDTQKEEISPEENSSMFPMTDEFEYPHDAILDSLPRINSSFHPENLEETLESHDDEKESNLTKETSKKPKVVDLRAKKEAILKTLSSYVETCSIQHLTHRALNAILFYHCKSNYKDGIQIDDINVYNPLLKEFAQKGNMKKIFETLKIMEPLNISLNLQSYIILLEAVGRKKNDKSQKQFGKIRNIINQAVENGFTFDKMMNEGSFLNDERNEVLEAMKKIDGTYKPTYNLPNVQYDNELVNSLNHNDQLKMPKYHKNTNGIFSRISLEERMNQQIAIEKNMNITIRSVEAEDNPTEEVLKYRKVLEDHYETWRDCATKAFNRDLFSLTSRRSATNNDVYFKSIPVEDFASIIVEEAKKLAQGSETYSPTVNMLYRDLGSKVYNRFKVLRKRDTGVLDKILSIHRDYCRHYAASHDTLKVLPESTDNLNTRQKWQWIEYQQQSYGATLDMNHREWVPSVLIEIGKFLYHIVMHDLLVDVNCMKLTSKNKKYLPAFYTIFRSQGRVTKEEVKPHPVLSRLYRASNAETLTFAISETPMLCPPIPWTSVRNGGYLITPCEMVRLPNYAMMQKQKMEAVDVQQLYPSLDSLNQLSSVPWKVNTKILDVILEVFNNGGSDKLDIPQPPSSLPTPEPLKPIQEMDKAERYNFFRQKLHYRRKKAEMYSLRCDCLYRLSLAQHFRNEIFWLPHNMDFRGRVYPIPPHLNHLGSDLARSMLVFAEPRPLGPEGLDWLKIHLINLTGLKKRDRTSDRLNYANECMDLILDSADRPLTGKKWWANSDEPWQTLACCLEISEAVRSGDPENFKSHFPVHQDGSCNGLQHYAALGRDKAGGFSVNLCPSEVPQDVYSAVVSLVEERRKIDAQNGVEVAKLLDGFVKRKVIKQTIMTTVYGVTRFGARLQIAKQLKDIEEFPKDQVFAASHYLTSKTFDSLRTMFTSTKEIQDWFTECARLISSVGGRQVEWVTPMGLPIVQPYFKFKKLEPNSVYEPFLMDKYEKPNVMKQKNAFPPNFIHSLDSSHMMLTSLNCERAGITFVSVHDCFWTHSSTVHIMNKICREQFVALHSQPILEDLSIFLSNHYSYSDLSHDHSVIDLTKKKLNRVLARLPRTGDLDITQVLDSVYFFS